MQDSTSAKFLKLEEKSRRKNFFLRSFLYFILILFSLYFIFPLVVMILTSLKTMEEIRQGTLLTLPKTITLDYWKIAWGGRGYGAGDTFLRPYFWNSLKMVVPAVIFSTFLGAMTGYILTKWRFKGDSFVFLFLLFGCFIPYQAILLPMARTLGLLGISNSIFGLIFVHSIYGIPFTTLFFRNYYISIPNELIKAARIDGAGFFKIFFKILIPISSPIIVVTVIWQFTQIWNDFLFGATFSFGEHAPIQVALNNMVLSSTAVKEYNVDMAAAIIAGIPTLIVYVLAGKYFIRGLTSGAVKG
jgi:glucose/mannose transport system permease protein|tara:strand:- start:2279 stop:3181 length:903 start_codon:yes stop_codon:yes gene_type:complete